MGKKLVGIVAAAALLYAGASHGREHNSDDYRANEAFTETVNTGTYHPDSNGGRFYLCSAVASSFHVIVPGAKSDGDVDSSKVYHGQLKADGKYESIGYVDFNKAIEATPEHKEINDKKSDVGPGKYWILLSTANDRIKRAINDVGTNKGFNFILENDYFSKLEVKAVDKDGKESDADTSELDLTDIVIKEMKDFIERTKR